MSLPRDIVAYFKLKSKLELFFVQGGGILNFTALVICGNGDGVAGYGKGKSAEVSAAVDKVCLFLRSKSLPWTVCSGYFALNLL